MLQASELLYLPILLGLFASPQSDPSPQPVVIDEDAVNQIAVEARPATPSPWAMTRWGLHEGLPQGQVYAICEDEEGTLWLGTYGGLARFDGRELRAVDEERFPLLTAARVSSLAYDETTQRVYVGSNDNGLFAIEGDDVIPLNRRRRNWGGTVDNLALLPDGTFWISSPSGAYRLNKEGNIEEEVHGRTGEIFDLFVAEDLTLWIGAEFGAFSWKNGALKQYSNLSCKALMLTAEGKLLMGDHHHRLVELDLATEEFRAWRFDEDLGGINTFIQEDQGAIWIGGQKPMRWDGETFEFALSDFDFGRLRNLPCHSMYLDREGSVWFGSAGLQQLRPSATSALALPEFESDTPRSVLVDPEDENVTWVAHVSGRVTRLDRGQVTHSIDGVGRSLAVGSDGKAYGCMEGVGISRLDIAHYDEHLSFEVVVPPEQVGAVSTRALLADPNGGWWVGSHAKLFYIAPDGNTQVYLPNKDLGVGGRIVHLAWSPQGELWVGSKDGVCVLKDFRVVQRLFNGDELAHGEVRGMHFRENGLVWLGHYGGGVSIMYPDGSVRKLTTRDGLHENVVSEIHADPYGNLLLLGNRGITVLSEEAVEIAEANAEEAVFARIFDHTPTLPELEGMGGAMPGSSVKSDGSVVFPALQAVVTFKPSTLAMRLPAPKVEILRLTVGRGPNQEGDSSASASLRSVIAIYGARTFVDNDLVRFRHRLVGLSSEWSTPSAMNVAHYSYLPPGDYRFEVQARNRDGIWSDIARSETVNFTPIWHERGSTRFLGALALALVIGALWWARVRSDRVVRQRLQAEVHARTAQLERHRERLQQDVALRTDDLQQALTKLQADMDARERLAAELRRSERLQALGRFSGGIAHDFNNILTAILGDAELGQTKASDEKTRQRFSRIRSAGERASQLIRQMLAFGGQGTSQLDIIDLNACVTKCTELFEAAIPKTIRLQLDLCDENIRVRLEASQLEQVLMNLVFNARDAIESTGAITLRTRRYDATRVAIEVIDNGQGIPNEELHHVFDPFFTTKEPGKGTGLGLASVHGIVEQAGGEVLIDSQIGVGTRLTVVLPAQKATVDSSQAPEPAHVVKVELPERPAVLLCDDEPEVLRVMERALEEDDIELLVAQNPQDALTIASRFPGAIHLLVTDLVMPNMNGVELADRLRKARPEIQIAYLSGFSQRGITAATDLDASIPFLAKPFLPTDFRDFVANLVKSLASEQARQGLP